MSDEPNTYQYIVKKQALLNTDALNERIAELEAANNFLKEQNDNLSFLSNRIGNVYRAQRLDDFVNTINAHLLNNDLEIEFVDCDEDGIEFRIPDALLSDGIISRSTRSFTVSGTVTLDWSVEVNATDSDEASEIAERHVDGADYQAYFASHPQVEEADIDTYNLSVDVSDVCEN
jgi:hypothetical protein